MYIIYIFKWILFFFILLFRATLRHMEVPRLGVESEPFLPAYTTATATRDPSRVCDLYHSSWQCQILNPLNKARDRTRILLDTSQVYNLLSHNINSLLNSTKTRKTLEFSLWLSDNKPN